MRTYEEAEIHPGLNHFGSSLQILFRSSIISIGSASRQSLQRQSGQRSPESCGTSQYLEQFASRRSGSLWVAVDSSLKTISRRRTTNR